MRNAANRGMYHLKVSANRKRNHPDPKTCLGSGWLLSASDQRSVKRNHTRPSTTQRTRLRQQPKAGRTLRLPKTGSLLTWMPLGHRLDLSRLLSGLVQLPLLFSPGRSQRHEKGHDTIERIQCPHRNHALQRLSSPRWSNTFAKAFFRGITSLCRLRMLKEKRFPILWRLRPVSLR